MSRPSWFALSEKTERERARARRPKKFRPQLTFGPCPKCGRERTCVHQCPVDPMILDAARQRARERW